MSRATLFDEDFYIAENADVSQALSDGLFTTAQSHFNLFGGRELRAPNSIFSPSFYAASNPDVLFAVDLDIFDNVFHHYQVFGEIENRIPSSAYQGFNAELYLGANFDVSVAVGEKSFKSALDHFISFGQLENRAGVNIQSETFFLTDGLDNIKGTVGNDTFIADLDKFGLQDVLKGGGGRDSLTILGPTRALGVASFENISGIERINIVSSVHQSADFAALSGAREIKLSDGQTIDGSTIRLTLGTQQKLILVNIKDGDTELADILDGGIKIDQPASSPLLDIETQGLGGPESGIEKSIVLDVGGDSVSTVNLSSLGTNYLSIENSGAALTNLNISGSGTLDIVKDLPFSVSSLDAGAFAGSIKLALKSNSSTILGSSGVNSISIKGGAHSVTLHDADDHVELAGGAGQIRTGAGGDTIQVNGANSAAVESGSGVDRIDILSGTNTIDSGSDNDIVRISRGSNTVLLGPGDDNLKIFNGNNNISAGMGSDTINIFGGTNVINSEAGSDIISASAGTNTFNSGGGDDEITLTGGTNGVSFGEGNDILRVSEGTTITLLDGGSGTDTIIISSTAGVTLPTANSFERYIVSDNIHQSLDFSIYSVVNNVQLSGGTTIDGSTISLDLGGGQGLTLTELTDGDTAAASLSDGGIRIEQASSVTDLNLTLNDVGPASSIANENIFIDIAGAGVSTANITSGNDSFVVMSNSGGALTSLKLLGSGTMALGTLPSSVSNIDGTAASANLTLSIGSTGSNIIKGGDGNDAITLTGGTNDVDLGPGNDTVTTASNLTVGDRINGGDGMDTFELIQTGLATVPSMANLVSIESFRLQDTVHQSLDFSSLTSITGIELESGTTLNGATITTTLGSGQTLTLDSITDGDTAAASLADGGISIAQPNSASSLDLTLDDIGPNTAATNENIFIDIAGSNVGTANFTTLNDSFIVLENSGGALSTLNIEGAGSLDIIGTLANSITTINGSNSTANLNLTVGSSGGTTTTGSGSDTVTLTGGTNNLTTNNGADIVIAGSGTNNIGTGSGNDQVTLSNGTNNLTTGASNDQITLSGGNNTVNSGASNDQLTISGGTNNIDTESGNDQITISGGNNTLTTGNNNDTISASNGVNNINTGSGTDQITLTGGTNTIVTGNNDDTVNASGGNNDIDTDAGSDQVVLTGGTNDVDTGANDDTVTLGGTDTVDMGSGNDTVEAGATLSTADTVNGGDGTGDTIEVTSALTDALTARLSNFEILEIKGGGGITHDISGLTGLTSLKASGALSGAVVITDLAEAAEVDISAAISNNLTINQINSAGGSDTLTFDFSGSSFTTGGSVIAPNIETVTLKTSDSGAKTISGGTFADATNVIITATGSNFIINDFTATNITGLDASSSNKIVTITTGADVFSSAFTYSGSSTNDRLDFDGATLTAGTVFELGQGQDTLTLNADAVATVVRTSATNSGNAFSIRDDASSANTASFTSGSDTFDYNGSLSHDSVTSVVATSGATLQAAVAADADATVYVIQDADGDADLETAIDNFADNVGRGRANTLESEAVDTGLLSYTGLDAAFDSSDIVLIAIDSETNEEATTANNGGTAVYRFQNSDTSTADTVLSSELELIGVFQDAALGTGDFV